MTNISERTYNSYNYTAAETTAMKNARMKRRLDGLKQQRTKGSSRAKESAKEYIHSDPNEQVEVI